jgi:peptide deformylase
MGNKFQIITHPNPILRRISKEVDVKKIKHPDQKETIKGMVSTMLEKDGVGLAAPQIGINDRIIVVNTKDRVIAMINPEITRKSITKEAMEEGCISVPGIFGNVKRNKKIDCIFYNEEGKRMKLKASGLLARIIQHETDHLDGILFIDKADDLKKDVSG